ncbi:MAG: hypothetical protein AAFX99_37175, partial [Myxococcota bacterium]
MDGEHEMGPCGACGSRLRSCVGGQWTAWSACSEGVCQVCEAGQQRTAACGVCGVRVARCEDGSWTEWSALHIPA